MAVENLNFRQKTEDLSNIFVSKEELLDKLNNGTLSTGIIRDIYLTDVFKDSGLWAWGSNGFSSLGLNDSLARSSPAQVGASTDWYQVASGSSFSLAIKSNGTLWSWGRNIYGQLGLNLTTTVSSPVQVGALTNWKQVFAGGYHVLAVKIDGTLWSWGRNNRGQLGQNQPTTSNLSSPVQVGALTNWRQISTGDSHSLAVKTDGTLWSWGRNNRGQLGLNDIIDRSSPVQVGALTNWKQVDTGTTSNPHSLAVKTDGTLWSWGNNDNGGQLGLNLSSFNDRSSPTQVGALTNWKQVSAGRYHSASVKSDGTLWTWGNNFRGQLGLGVYSGSVSSPTQVGALTNWKEVELGASHGLAVKTDGTLWSWGGNNIAFNSGPLGLNDIINRSSPVQIGALTTWKQVSSFGYNVISLIKP